LGKKKNAEFIASLFDPWIQKLDPGRTRVDCVFFDGASNVQLAGQLLATKYPRIHVQTCAAHSVSLFFSDICKKLWQMRLLLVNYRRLYRLFGSGSMHIPYALFCHQSQHFNNNRTVGLLRASDTRMAGHCYAQVRMLRLREPLIATITSREYLDLKLKGFAKRVEHYLMDNDMWEATSVIQECLFPMIRVLRLGDKSSCGGMSQIIYFVHKTDEAFKNSMGLLKDLKYFRKAKPSDADEVDDDLEVDDAEDSDDGADVDPVVDDDGGDVVDISLVVEKHLGEQMFDFWNHRRKKLITPLSIAAWFCSPQEEIREDVLLYSTAQDRAAVDLVVGSIYYPIRDEELAVIRQTFWLEFDDFQTKRGPAFSRPFIFNAPEVESAPHQWHKINSVNRDAKVFGRVACRVCSKPLGCGGAERTWGTFKHLKNGKRSHLGADRAVRQATVYGAACIEKGRAIRAAEESTGLVIETRWSDADILFQMEAMAALENANVPLAVVPIPVPVPAGVPVPVSVLPTVLVFPVAAVPVPVLGARRLFRAWIEEDEWTDIDTNHLLARGRLLHKYEQMHFQDENGDWNVVKGLEFSAGRAKAGWQLQCENLSDGEVVHWRINDVIDMIGACVQPEALNVEIIVDEPKRADNILQQVAIDAEKRAKAEEKKNKAIERRLAREQRRINI
jgi:hypothetical protein